MSALLSNCPSGFPRTRRALQIATCATCATVIAMTACSADDTEEVVKVINPVKPADLDDSAPAETPYDESLSFEGRFGTENHSAERFRFDVAAYADDAERDEAAILYPSHAAWLEDHGASDPYNTNAIPSVQTIGTYVKQMDDTIYAGVELALHEGLEDTLEPKREVLTGALDYLLENRNEGRDEAACWVGAALRLGGGEGSVPTDLETCVQSHIDDFLTNLAESKPIGFYTWSEDLQEVWKQDRFLQAFLPTDTACFLAEAIAADDVRQQRYIQLINLYSRLTNPLHSSLVEMLPVASEAACLDLDSAAFLSSSRTPEVTLFNALYPDGVPDGANLMEELVDAIRNGTVDLTPGDDDGWYAHQLYALETLLVTDESEERGKVAFMARYKKRLREAFETMLTQHRETHVKQADRSVGTSAPAAPFTPHFRLEPLATVYVRHARSYVFLEHALDEVMGEDFLDQAVAVSEDGPGSATLRDTIRAARGRFFGLYLVACQDIGLKPTLSTPGDPDESEWKTLAAEADSWLLGLSFDPMASQDARVIVPIALLPSGRWQYWAVIGVRSTLAGYSYIQGDDVSPPSPEDQARVWLPTEQFLEVASSAEPLSRDEFRSLCDQHKTAEAIQAALEAR